MFPNMSDTSVHVSRVSCSHPLPLQETLQDQQSMSPRLRAAFSHTSGGVRILGMAKMELLTLVSSDSGSGEIKALAEKDSQFCRDKGSNAGEPQAPSMPGIAVGAGNDSQGSWTCGTHLPVCPRKYMVEICKAMEFLLKRWQSLADKIRFYCLM